MHLIGLSVSFQQGCLTPSTERYGLPMAGQFTRSLPVKLDEPCDLADIVRSAREIPNGASPTYRDEVGDRGALTYRFDLKVGVITVDCSEPLHNSLSVQG